MPKLRRFQGIFHLPLVAALVIAGACKSRSFNDNGAGASIGSDVAAVGNSGVAQFGQLELNSSKVIAVARILASDRASLIVFEQLEARRLCWKVGNGMPAAIDALMLNFDFTGICGRATDSNGYSVRAAGQDLGVNVSLSVIRSQNDFVLVARKGLGEGQGSFAIGRTNGLGTGLLKIELDPAWRITKRSFNGQALGHYYLTSNSLPAFVEGGITPSGEARPVPVPVVTVPSVRPSVRPSARPPARPTAMPPMVNVPPASPVATPANPDDHNAPNDGDNANPVRFSDIAGNVYVSEIEHAAALGIVAGLGEDRIFSPRAAATREQLVVMAVNALAHVLPGDVVPADSEGQGAPFADVAGTRWSAGRIRFAKDNGLVTGYPGTSDFKPAASITRAEMIAVLFRTAEYVRKKRDPASVSLPVFEPPTDFSDVKPSYWGAAAVRAMSGYCRVASPLNESGIAFHPDATATRDAAAAATVRLVKCLKRESNR